MRTPRRRLRDTAIVTHLLVAGAGVLSFLLVGIVLAATLPLLYSPSDVLARTLIILVGASVASAIVSGVVALALSRWLYRAFVAGTPSPLPEPLLQYADAVWDQERRMGAGALDAHVDFWRAELAGALRARTLTMSGPRALQRGFGRWFAWSAFAPASQRADERRRTASRLAGPQRVRVEQPLPTHPRSGP